MKKQTVKIAVLSLLLLAIPISGKADISWTVYKPGVVKAAVDNGETVVLGYLSSW